MAGRYKAYPDYKDSGVEWIGVIPSTWDMWKIAHSFPYVASGTTPKTDSESYYGGENLWVTTGELREGVIVDTKKRLTDKALRDLPTLRLHPSGSVAIAMYGATIGRLGIFGGAATTNQACCVMPPSETIYNKYLFYWLFATRDEIINLSSGGGQPNVNQEKISSLKISAPPLPEQKQIARFLDHETGKIDALIEKQQALIALLKEKRQAVISHAVTKGLNPDAKMKDSGVEWLGEVPEHWEVRTVSRASNKITNGYVGPTRDILVDSGVSYVQATHIKRGKVYFDDAYFVRKTWSDAHAKSILVKGDVLIVQTGAGTGDIGLVSDDEVGFNCHALIIVAPDQSVITGDYLSMVFQSQYGFSVLYSIRTGGMHPHLNCGEVQYVKLPIPPLDEQAEIISFIYQQIQRFDYLVLKAESAIELMQERRTALISAAVTGKIDVRDWTAPEEPVQKGEV